MMVECWSGCGFAVVELGRDGLQYGRWLFRVKVILGGLGGLWAGRKFGYLLLSKDGFLRLKSSSTT